MLLCMQQVLKPERQNSQYVNVTMVVFKHRHLLFRVGKKVCFGLKYLKLLPQTQLEMSWLPVKIVINMSGCTVRPTHYMKFCRPSSKISSGFTLMNAETQSRTVVTGLLPLSNTIPSTSWCESQVVNMWMWITIWVRANVNASVVFTFYCIDWGWKASKINPILFYL